MLTYPLKDPVSEDQQAFESEFRSYHPLNPLFRGQAVE
jgi:hypothetical protein